MAVLIVTRVDKDGLTKSTLLPTPSTMKITLQDIDASTTTRSVHGELIRDRVRGGSTTVRKIECTWKGLRISEAAKINQAVSDESFTLDYPDTYTGSRRGARFYVGDRSAEVYTINPDGSGAVLSNVSMNFIEF